jgi:hypothetical protein
MFGAKVTMQCTLKYRCTHTIFSVCRLSLCPSQAKRDQDLKP